MRSILRRLVAVSVVIAAFAIGGTGTVRAQPAGFETFYVLGREAQVYQMFRDVQALEGRTADVVLGQMSSVISLTATANFQKIYYDHWEDGYERDILNPVQASTQVLSLNRGQSATFASREGAVAGTISDYVPANPRGTALRYDGGDKIVSSGGPINVSRALWPRDGQYIGGAWELYATRTLEQNYRYRVPVGVDSFTAAGNPFSEFRSVYLQVQATSSDTQVVVDNGVTQVQFDLDEGQTWSSRGAIDALAVTGTDISVRTGTTIYASKAVQAGIITAGVGAYQARFFQIFPETLFGTDYVVPVPSRVSTAAGNRAEIYLFNPNTTAVTVSWWDSSGTGSFSIPSRAARAYSQSTAANHYVPVNSAVRVKSSGLIWGIGSGGSDGTGFDWGFSLIPQRFADDETVTAWAPGNYGLTANLSPVYVSAYVPGTTIRVDRDFNGTFDGPTYTLNALDSIEIFDPDFDLSGARIVGSDPFIAAYGCDPLQGDATNNLDWGNTVLPLSASYLDPVLAVVKTASPALLPLAGGRVEFNLAVTSGTRQPLTDVDVVDRLPAGFLYEAGSAWVHYPNGDAYAVAPSVTATGLVWDLSHTMSAAETLTVTFAATVTVASPPLAGQTYTNVGEASCLLVANRFVARDEASVQRSALSLSAAVSATTTVVGGRLVYTITARNTYSSNLSNVIITNPVPAATVYVAGSAGVSYSGPGNQVSWNVGNLAAGATAIVTFAVDALPAADGYEIKNKARATATGIEPVRSNEVVTVIAGGRLVVTKDGPGNVTAGGDLVYRLTASSLGSATAAAVVLEDRIPAGTTYLVGSASAGAIFLDAAGTPITPTGVTDANVKTVRWSIGTLPPTGAGQTRSFTVRSSASLLPGATILNVAEASASNARSAVSNPVITTVTLVRIRKSVSRDLARPGHITTFTLDFWNESTIAASNVVVTDAIPERTSYLSGTALVPSGVTVTYSTDGGLTYGAAPPVSVGLPTAVTHLRYTAASLPASPSTTKTVSFQVRVDNPLPAGTTIENQAGLTAQFLTPRVSADGFESRTYSGGTYWATNWLESGDDTSPTGGNILITNTGSPMEGTYHLRLGGGGVSIRRAVNLAGTLSASLTFWRKTANYSNNNKDFAYLEVATSPTGPWTLLRTYSKDDTAYGLQTVDLSGFVGSTVYVQFRAEADGSSEYFYVDDVRVSALMAPTPVLSNIVRIPTVDLDVSKVADRTAVVVGDYVWFTLTYSNKGSATATSVVLDDSMTSRLVVDAPSMTGGGTSPATNRVTWALGDIPPLSGERTVRFRAQVASGAPGTILNNNVTLGNAIDLPEYNTASAWVVVRDTDVTLAPDALAVGARGSWVTFAHRLVNTGSVADVVEFQASDSSSPWDLTNLQYQVYIDVDGDGVYDPGLDTPLPVVGGWYQTPSLAPNEVLRLVVRAKVPSSGVADDEEHEIVLTARRKNATGQTSDVKERIRVLGTTAVLLRSFRATGSDAGVVVGWETLSEVGSIGFRVLRSESPDGGDAAAVGGLVMARGARGGASYEVSDPSATVGLLYWYWLEESVASGRTRRYGPVGVDWDGDGMADWWELEYGLAVGLDDAALDGDGDGLSNLDEFLGGTDPGLADRGPAGELPEFDEVVGASVAGVRILARDDSGVVLELVTPSYAVQAEPAGVRLVLPDYAHGSWTVPGEPLVPVKGLFLALPQGCEAGQPELMSVDEAPPAPVPVLRPVGVSVPVEGSDPPRFTEELSWTGSAWSSTVPWPVEAVTQGESIPAGGLRYAKVSFFPVAWNPAEGTASLRTRILVRIPFVAAAAPSVDVGSAILGLEAVAAALESSSDWSGYPTAEHPFFRLRTTATGLHKLTYDDLTSPAVGWPTGSIPAQGVALFDATGELPLRIEPETGFFGPGSVLYFLSDAVGSKYDDGSYLFLTPDMGRPGLRMADWTPIESESASPVTTYRARERYAHDGALGYGPYVPGYDEDRFFAGYSYTVVDGGSAIEHPFACTLDLTGARADAADVALVRVRVATERSYDDIAMDHRVLVRLGGTEVAWGEFDGAGFADVEGTFAPLLLVDGPMSVAVALGLAPGVVGFDRVFVDSVELTYTSTLRARLGRLDFSLPVGAWLAHVTALTSSTVVGVRVDGLTGDQGFLTGGPAAADAGGSWTLDLPVEPVGAPARVLLADPTALPAPAVLGVCGGSALRDDPTGADLVVVAPAALAAALEPLLAHRRAQGLAVRVVAPEDAYDQFAGGSRSPWAFRSLLSWALSEWAEPRPRYLMLVGDTTWDPRNRMGLLPVGVDPADLLPTPLLASFGGAGETACDAVLGRPDGTLPSVAVGRLPFRSAQDVSAFVAKVLAYEGAPDGLPFESAGLFVAGVDTGISTPFVLATEGGIRFLPAGAAVARVVQADYAAASSVRQAIVDTVNGRGALVLNYHGHGNMAQWSDPKIFGPADVSLLVNDEAPVFLVGMTCLDGFFARADLTEGIAEAWVRRSAGGAVAAFCAAGTASIPAKQLLNDGLFEALYRGGVRRVGDAVLEASRTYLANQEDTEDVVATHALLGDPCLRLRLPFPAAPSGVGVSALGGGAVQVSWTGGTETDLAGYRIMRSASLGGVGVDVAGGLLAAPTVEFVDTPGPGVWYYTVQALDVEGFESPRSTEASVTLVPTASGGGGGGGCTVGTGSTSASGWALPWLLVPLAMVTTRRRRLLKPVAVRRGEA